MKRSHEIDALRGIAVLMVVGFHYFGNPTAGFHGIIPEWVFSGGWAGVDLFFVISGYLLGGQLLDGGVGLRAFYLRRAARIFPLYLILLLVAAIANPMLHPIPYLTMTQNIAFALGMDPQQNGLALTWSLAVEEQFYLALPAVIFLIPRRRLPLALGLIALGSVAARAVSSPEAAYYLLPCRADALALGVLLAWRARYAPIKLPKLPRCRALERVGELSYAVYLFHGFASGWAIGLAGNGVIGAGVAFATVIGLAIVLRVTVESPIHTWAKRYTPPQASSERANPNQVAAAA